MREFEHVFDMGLKHGIRRNTRYRTSGQILTECHNFIVGDDGLEPYSPRSQVTSWYNSSGMMGFPILHAGDKENYLIGKKSTGETKIYTISGTTLTARYTYPYTGYYAAYPTEWVDVADFGNYVVFSGGPCCCMHSITLASYLSSDILSPTTPFPGMLTCCNFRGQLVGGGVTASGTFPPAGQISKKHVIFSAIGSLDMVWDRKNEAGSHYIPTRGEIRRVLPMADHVIVYATDGIWALTPVIEPAPTYRKRRIYKEGIANPWQVDGDDFDHVAVTSSGRVLRINNDLKVINLDYQEYFPLPSFVRVTMDKQYREWIINRTNVGAYYLTERGLSTTYQQLWALLEGTNYSVGLDSTDTKGRIETDLTDFGMAGIKTVTGVEVAGDYPAGQGTVTIKYRYEHKDAFVSSTAVSLNKAGAVGKPVSGIDFKFVVEFPTNDVKIDFIKIRWKMSDMRFLRGVYSPPPRGQYVS